MQSLLRIPNDLVIALAALRLTTCDDGEDAAS